MIQIKNKFNFIEPTVRLAKEMIASMKEDGFKITLKRFKWKFLLLIFVYYLIRDILIYVVIPAMSFYVIKTAAL